jgi:hypothetical protein
MMATAGFMHPRVCSLPFSLRLSVDGGLRCQSRRNANKSLEIIWVLELRQLLCLGFIHSEHDFINPKSMSTRGAGICPRSPLLN